MSDAMLQNDSSMLMPFLALVSKNRMPCSENEAASVVRTGGRRVGARVGAYSWSAARKPRRREALHNMPSDGGTEGRTRPRLMGWRSISRVAGTQRTVGEGLAARRGNGALSDERPRCVRLVSEQGLAHGVRGVLPNGGHPLVDVGEARLTGDVVHQ